MAMDPITMVHLQLGISMNNVYNPCNYHDIPTGSVEQHPQEEFVMPHNANGPRLWVMSCFYVRCIYFLGAPMCKHVQQPMGWFEGTIPGNHA